MSKAKNVKEVKKEEVSDFEERSNEFKNLLQDLIQKTQVTIYPALTVVEGGEVTNVIKLKDLK